MSGQFEELLAQLNAAQEEQSTLAKALPADDGEDDEAIQAAAADGEPDGDEDRNPEDEDDADGDEGKPMTKSMVIGDEEVEVIDAEALVKSLDGLGERMTKSEEVLTKGLTSALALIKGQGDLIKSMQARIDKLAGKGAGRKTLLTVHEKQDATLAKSQQDGGMTAGEFMAKSEAAWKDNVITGREFTAIDVAMRSGQIGALDQGLINKVLQK